MGSTPPIQSPVVNPVEIQTDGAVAPQPTEPSRKPRRSWQVAPATYLLIGLNCAVFLAMVLNHVNWMQPDSESLMHWGANHTGYVLEAGQWGRIVSAMFIHVGILHLATNMWCLWNLGLLAEPLIGSWGVVAAYLLTGAAGNLLSTGYNWWTCHLTRDYPIGAGASGAVFGVAGILIILLKSPQLKERVPLDDLRKLRRSVVLFAVLNILIDFGVDGFTRVYGMGVRIDNAAHLGGFLCGLLYAVPLVPRFCSPKPLFLFRLRASTAMIVGILVLFGFYLAQLPG